MKIGPLSEQFSGEIGPTSFNFLQQKSPIISLTLKQYISKWHVFIDKYHASVLYLEYYSTLFLKYHHISHKTVQNKNFIMTCYPIPLVDCTHKMKQIYKVKILILHHMGKFFISNLKALAAAKYYNSNDKQIHFSGDKFR